MGMKQRTVIVENTRLLEQIQEASVQHAQPLADSQLWRHLNQTGGCYTPRSAQDMNTCFGQQAVGRP